MKPIFSHYRHGVSFKTVAFESNSVTEEMTGPRKETTLPTILSHYTLKKASTPMCLAYFTKPCQATQCISNVKSALVEGIEGCV